MRRRCQLAAQKMPDMTADILGPVGNQSGASGIVVAAKRTKRLLIAGAVTAKVAHEVIRGVAPLLCAGRALTRGFDQPAQCCRRTARLRCEPIPVPRQQRDLARLDAKPRTPRGWRRECG